MCFLSHSRWNCFHKVVRIKSAHYSVLHRRMHTSAAHTTWFKKTISIRTIHAELIIKSENLYMMTIFLEIIRISDVMGLSLFGQKMLSWIFPCSLNGSTFTTYSSCIINKTLGSIYGFHIKVAINVKWIIRDLYFEFLKFVIQKIISRCSQVNWLVSFCFLDQIKIC